MVLAVILVSRLPFLDAGYGNDPDAWAVAQAARQIAETGHYMPSRLPGYPLQELVCSLLWKGGPLALNGCTAIMGLVAAAFFIRTMRRLGSPDALLAGLALAFVPVIFVNSTNSLDYVWALAFLLAAHDYALARRAVLAGIFMGAAIGTRLSSGLLLLPLAYLLAAQEHAGRRLAQALRFGIAASVLGLILFAPVMLDYGWGFLSFNRPAQYPALSILLSRLTLRVWGLVGMVGFLAAMIITWLPFGRKPRELARIPQKSTPARNPAGTPGDAATIPRIPLLAAVITLVLQIALFLWLPLEEGYLIPAVPFAIIVLARILKRHAFHLACGLVCLSPYLCGVGRVGVAPKATLSPKAVTVKIANKKLVLDPLRGPVLHDYALRLHGMAFADRVLHRAAGLAESSVVIVGYWLPEIQVRMCQAQPPFPAELGKRFIYLADQKALHEYEARDTSVYYLPEMNAFNLETYGIDLAESGARVLDEYWQG